MKKIIACMVLVLSLATITTYAQNGDGGDRRAAFLEKRKQMLKDSLGLTDEKVKSVTDIDDEYRPKQMEIFRDQSISQEDKMAKIKTLNEEKNTKLKTVLTDDQITKLEGIEQRQRAQMRHGDGPGGPGGPGGGQQ